MDWICLAQGRGNWQEIVNEVTKFGFRNMRRISELTNELEAFQEGPCYTELTEVIFLRYFLFILFLYSLNVKKEAVYSAETAVVVYISARCVTF